MTLPLVDDPSIADLVDDTGTGQDGTVLSKANFVAIAEAIDDALIAPGETQTPGETTTEVIEARGNMPSLDDRISGVINDDGEFIVSSSITTSVGYQLSENLVQNDDFRVWDRDTAIGVSVAPVGYLLYGTGVYTVTKCGIGQADTKQLGGRYCARVDTTGTAGLLLQIAPTSLFEDDASRQYSIGCYVYANQPNQARMQIASGSGSVVTPYASILNGKTWISATGTLGAAGGVLSVLLEVAQPGTVYFGGVTVVFGAVAPQRWVPCRKVRQTMVLPFSAFALGTETLVRPSVFAFPGGGQDFDPVVVEKVHLFNYTLGNALMVNVQRAYSGAWQAMVAAPLGGSVTPDYPGYSTDADVVEAYSCFGGANNSSIVRGVITTAGTGPIEPFHLELLCTRYAKFSL